MVRLRFLVLALLIVSSAHAATYVWTGVASDRFSDPANRTGGSPAGDMAAELKFSATTGSRLPVNDIAALRVHSIVISEAGYRISGNAITVTGEVIASADEGVVASDLVLAGDVTFWSHGAFAVDGAIRGDGRLIKRGPGSLVFRGPREMTKTVSVKLVGDRQHESDETFRVRVTSMTNARVVRSEGIVTIVDDDTSGRRRSAGR